MKTIVFFIIFILVEVVSASDIGSLLDELATKGDLSFQTKKETAGFIKIFTREDLDRMKIKSLDEIIDKIPFLRNKLDNYGLNDPYYFPFQTTSNSRIRLFLDDKELAVPLYGSGMRLIGQLDISYIDHIEIYHGAPSYTISIEPSVVLIKAYTKIGERENTNTIGASIGSNNTYNTYAYSSAKIDDYSYFAYINHRDLNRDKVDNLGTELSRDKDATQLYTQLTNNTSSLKVQIIDGEIDSFAGRSGTMQPENANTNFKYLSTTYSYLSLDESFKAVVSYMHLNSTENDFSYTPLGLRAISTYPYIAAYYQVKAKMTEQMLDMKVTKTIKINDTSILFGVSNRWKKFDFDEMKYDNVDYSNQYTYNSENILSLFTEVSHHLDDKNELILSLNAQRYFEKGAVSDDNIYGTKLGHIYTQNDFVQKSFLYYGKFHASPLDLMLNNYYSDGLNDLKSEIAYGISTQSLWNYKDISYSLLFARNFYKNQIYLDATSILDIGYKNSKDKYIFDTVSFETTYGLNNSDKIDFNAWAIYQTNKNDGNDHKEEYGGSISLYKKFSSIDTYNSLSYVTGKESMADGWNYNATLSYQYSKNLTFFLKGVNLLDKALKSDYTSLNYQTLQLVKLENIDNIDRSIWLGLEYQF